MDAILDNDKLEILMEPYLPEESQHSDFFIDFILESKGDLPATTRNKKNEDTKSIDEKILRATGRTKDFVERTRMVPYSWQRREIYHARRHDRNYRKRIHPRKSGARSHLRNFRPEIPQISLDHRTSYLMTLDSIFENTEPIDTKPFLSDSNFYVSILSGEFKGTYRIGLVKDITEIEIYGSKPRKYSKSEFSNLLSRNDFSARFYYEGRNLNIGLSTDDGLERTFRFDLIENPAYVDSKTLQPLRVSATQTMLKYSDDASIVPRYSKKFKHEEPQSMPKIPYREIKNLRHGRQKKSKYMLVDAPEKSDGFMPSSPHPKRFSSSGATTWAYTPIVKLPQRSIYS